MHTDLTSKPYPPIARGRIVLWGMMGALPFGGMVWQVVHYLRALQRAMNPRPEDLKP